MTSDAERRAQLPSGIDGVLSRRSLQADFPALQNWLKPGFKVLDVGCASGALTQDMAGHVGEAGRVVGVDTNTRLLAQAKEHFGHLSHLSFQQADIYDLPFQNEFDVVVAARVFLWLDRPAEALAQLVRAARPGGRIVVVDYNQLKLEQQPPPPPSFLDFHAKYLHWRAQAGMDNEMADHLPQLFQQAGLQDIEVQPQHEETRRTDPDFQRRIGLKVSVVAGRGPQLVQEGWCSEESRQQAETEARHWAEHEAQWQKLYLLAVSGVKPGGAVMGNGPTE